VRVRESEISTPGPQKVQARRAHSRRLGLRRRVVFRQSIGSVVIGYSFLATDPSVMDLVLRHLNGRASAWSSATTASARSRLDVSPEQWKRQGSKYQALAEQFLIGGSVRPGKERFDHSIFDDHCESQVIASQPDLPRLLPTCCHAARTSTLSPEPDGTGQEPVTHEIDCKTAPHLGFG